MNLTILSFRSGTTPSLQGVHTESTAFGGHKGRKTIMCDDDHSNCSCFPYSMWRFLSGVMRAT